jgi:predicted dehydrogenase
MTSTKDKLRIAVVGLRFGGSFPPIYAKHPDVAEVTICDRDAATLNSFGDKFGFARGTTRLEDVLASKDIDAVHLVTPIPSHGRLTVQVLESRKHCACTVPMATTLEELAAIVAAQKRTGLNYMMMETAAYTYQCLCAQEMVRRGELGRIQFLRGAHYQDMENWPDYWMGLPPMHYATHAVAPLLKLAGRRATRVHCFGSGVMRPELHQQYGNPYPVETAIFQLDGENLAAEVTRSLFHTAREYAEIFSIYGEAATFEWVLENELPVVYRMAALQAGRGRPITQERLAPPSFRDRLPAEIREFDNHQIIPDPKNPHQSVLQGGGHHGSHPHLVHEFIRSIVEQRPPAIDAVTAANWSAAGICAHSSAMMGGAAIDIPALG